MTARLFVTRAQIKALAIAAKEAGCTVEVQLPDGTIYRVKPPTDGNSSCQPHNDAEGVAL